MKATTSLVIAVTVCIGLGLGPMPLHAGPTKVVISDKGLPVIPYGAPVRLRIPRIGVATKLESTSIDSKGILESPKDPKKAGWYRNGPMPGQPGNAIIVGHVDWYDGPAVFYRLSRLRKGDIVEVVNDYKITLRFRVTEVRSYANGSAPLNKIAGRTKHTHLNLVTCGGSYNRSAKNYSHRIVAYTELIQRIKLK